jgi:prophage regulatory protein
VSGNRPALGVTAHNGFQLTEGEVPSKVTQQPLGYHPSAFLRLPQVLALYPVSRSEWYQGMKEGRYPSGIKLGKRAVAWRCSAILQLLEERAKAAA